MKNPEHLEQLVKDLQNPECRDCDAAMLLLAAQRGRTSKKIRILKTIQKEMKSNAATNTLRNQTIPE